MDITELIKHLRKLRQEHGNLWVQNARGVLLYAHEIKHNSEDNSIEFEKV